MEPTARLFNCAYCQRQVVICSDCDRGNIYCHSCSRSARARSLRMASKRYQNSPKGKCNHAERQRRYQQKKKLMTHQGSNYLHVNDSLVDEVKDREEPNKNSSVKGIHCHFCGKCCSKFLRIGFLRHHSASKMRSLTSLSQGR